MTRVNRSAGLLVLVCANLSASVAATPSGEEILRRAALAARRVRYRGTRITTIWLDNRVQEIRCIEYADGHGRFRTEFLAPESAKGRVVIDDGKLHWQIEPDAKRIFRSASSTAEDHEMEASSLPLLTKNYHIRVDPHSHSVARRSVHKITLTPKHAGKPGRFLWIDTQTFLILKRDARHQDGSPARSTFFMRLSLNPQMPSSRFTFRTSAKEKIVSIVPPSHCKDLDAAKTFIGATAPFPSELPSLGFRVRTVSCRKKNHPVVHLLYDDDVATVSVFVDRKPDRSNMTKAKRVAIHGEPAWLKTDHHFGLLRWSSGGLRFTVVGDLAPDALLQAGRDFQQSGQPLKTSQKERR